MLKSACIAMLCMQVQLENLLVFQKSFQTHLILRQQLIFIQVIEILAGPNSAVHGLHFLFIFFLSLL